MIGKMMKNDIYIIKTPRREPNALSKSRVWAVFENDTELLKFIEKEKRIVVTDYSIPITSIMDITLLDKAVFSCDENDGFGNPIYLPHIFTMCRESRVKKPTFVKNAIRRYKLDLLLNG